MKIDLCTGAFCSDTEVFGNDHSDIEEIILDSNSKVAMLSYYYDKKYVYFFDSMLKNHYHFLVMNGPVDELHEINVLSKARNETLWLVSYEPSDAPSFYAVYNTLEKIVMPLFCSQPALLQFTFAPMEILKIPARDNLLLVSYLTRPLTRTASSKLPSPLVLLVHGGPWERDRYGFNPLVQWMTNRGYAVLQVNYRGSSGFGKRFMNMGDGEWGIGGMQNDLTDAVQWCIDHGIAQRDKICIFGASYGGYACLSGLSFTPHLYKCGVSIAGVSDLHNLLVFQL
jgi:dipeptidyl aminopeptidase/acylaminoacyl peptidase